MWILLPLVMAVSSSLYRYQTCMCPLQALFEQAVSEKSGQQFPLLWRCYMSYEMHRGRLDAARRVMLRAVHTCPGAKALWIDGLHFLAEQVQQFAV